MPLAEPGSFLWVCLSRSVKWGCPHQAGAEGCRARGRSADRGPQGAGGSACIRQGPEEEGTDKEVASEIGEQGMAPAPPCHTGGPWGPHAINIPLPPGSLGT